jgi:hypothetical protein
MTAHKATVLAAICSLLSAVLVAFVSGIFNKSTVIYQEDIKGITSREVEKIRQEGSENAEKIRQFSAQALEELRSDGQIKLEKFKLQRDLILKAIDTRNREEANRRLKFFAETGLIPDFEERVLNFTKNQPLNALPSIPTDLINEETSLFLKNSFRFDMSECALGSYEKFDQNGIYGLVSHDNLNIQLTRAKFEIWFRIFDHNKLDVASENYSWRNGFYINFNNGEKEYAACSKFGSDSGCTSIIAGNNQSNVLYELLLNQTIKSITVSENGPSFQIPIEKAKSIQSLVSCFRT